MVGKWHKEMKAYISIVFCILGVIFQGEVKFFFVGGELELHMERAKLVWGGGSKKNRACSLGL